MQSPREVRMRSDLDQFKEHYKRLDEMVADATKADLAECARLLALNVAQHVDWRNHFLATLRLRLTRIFRRTIKTLSTTTSSLTPGTKFS